MVCASLVTYRTDPAEVAGCLRCMTGESVLDTIYVVDNSPSQYLRPVVEGFPRTMYIHRPDNPGYGTAHNVAIRQSLVRGAAYHLVSNTDVWFDTGALSHIRDFMAARPDVGALSPAMHKPDGRPLYGVRLLPEPLTVLCRRFIPQSLSRMARTAQDRYLLKDWDHSHEANVPFLSGCFMFLNAQALRDCGLFDERFFMYLEDVDLSRRIHARYKTVFWPGVTITHLMRQASYQNLRMALCHSRSMIRYFNKWGWLKDPERDAFNAATLSGLR